MTLEEKRRKKAAYMRAYRAIHGERLRAYHREWRKAHNYAEHEREWRRQNRDKVLAYKKRDREKRPDDYRRWKRDWERRHAAKVEARKRRDYAANKEAIAKRLQEHRASHPEQYRLKQMANSAKRRARLANVPHEPIDRRAVYERDKRRCGICRRPVRWSDFSLDHVIPVSLGGAHTYDNVRTTHINCNKRRGNRDVQPRLELT